MNYFKYAKSYNGYRAMRIYQEVQNLKGYAISIYKGLWEDALDMSFFHILENFDENSGCELSHYALRVVGTILLGKYNHEIEHETSLETNLNKKSVEEDLFNPAHEILDIEEGVSVDIQECVRYLLPMFIQDYKFFKSKKSEDRKLAYTGLFNMFSYETINESMDLMVKLYGEDMDYLYNLKRNCHYRNFSEDRYKDSMDNSIEYECFFKDVLIYKKLQVKSRKVFYLFNIKDAVDSIIQTYYQGKCSREVGDLTVYCTLSGNLVTSTEELRVVLERELVGAVLSRFSYFKVVCYEKGKSIILSSTKELEHGFTLDIFNQDFKIPIRELVSKCSNS